MAWVLLVLLCGFQIKHFIADYLLQTPKMLAEKGEIGALGGYMHAAVHVIGSAIVLAVAGTKLPILIALLAAEFVVHYALDFFKAYYGRGVHSSDQPAKFWALHGLDQFLHQLTYAAMTFVAMLYAGL
jgi:hypothetical protein